MENTEKRQQMGVEMSQEIGEIALAMSKAQSEMDHAKKDAKNPHFRANYATLESVLDASKFVLSKHEIAVFQPTFSVGSSTFVKTMLVHKSGQFISGCIPVLAAKATSQSQGSGLTYARRYSLSSMVGIHQEDDDGEASEGRGKDGSTSPKIEYNQSQNAKPKTQPKQATSHLDSLKNHAPKSANPTQDLNSAPPWENEEIPWEDEKPSQPTVEQPKAAPAPTYPDHNAFEARKKELARYVCPYGNRVTKGNALGSIKKVDLAKSLSYWAQQPELSGKAQEMVSNIQEYIQMV